MLEMLARYVLVKTNCCLTFSPVRCEDNCCQVRKTVRLCSRKRKERTESSSSEQDNKFSRSSSLGCPLTCEELSLRWRSSSLCPLYDDGCGSGRGENVLVLHEVQESALPVSVRDLGLSSQTLSIFHSRKIVMKWRPRLWRTPDPERKLVMKTEEQGRSDATR